MDLASAIESRTKAKHEILRFFSDADLIAELAKRHTK
jgi:hypothetical protein